MTAEPLSLFKFRSPQTKVANVVNGWRRQYGDEPAAPDKAAILRKLKVLDLSKATPDEIAAIIGNRSWTDETCSVCQEDAGDAWLEFGGDSQIMCLSCVETAQIILGAVR